MHNNNSGNTAMKYAAYVFRGIALLVIIFAILLQTVWRVPARPTEECYELSGQWTRVLPDGTEETFELPCELDADIGETVIVKKVLPDNIDDNMHLMLFAGRDMKIFIDGELRKESLGSVKRYPGKSVKALWVDVPISKSDRGKELSIIKDEQKVYNGRFRMPYYGSLYSIVAVQVSKAGPEMVLTLGLFFISALVLILCLVLYITYSKKLTMLYLGYAVFAVAGWLLTDSELCQLLFNNAYADGVLSYLLCMYIPYAFVKFMNELQENRYSGIYAFCAIKDILVFIVFSVLHFTELLDFERALGFIDTSLCIDIVVIIALIVLDMSKGNMKKHRIIIVGIAGLIVCGVIEIILILTVPNRVDGIFAILGLYFLLLMTVVSTIVEFFESEGERVRALNSSSLKSSFLANMSHEIRTPINTILGMNEMILRENKDPDIAEYADSIDRSGKMLLGLVNDVLDFTKIEAGKVALSNEPYKTGVMLSDLATLLNSRVNNKSIEAVIDVDETIPSVLEGDEMQIKRIAGNLITNAVKYTKRGSVTLHVSWEQCPEAAWCKLIIKVSDTGIGIKEDQIDSLFDSFTRLEERRNRNIEGTGLGLSIVKNLVDAMNGTIVVNSDYGVGSTFTVSIPQYIVTRTQIGSNWLQASNEGRRKEYKPKFYAPDARVLAVDDNKSNLMIIKQFLKSTGVTIDTAQSGSEGVRLATENHYDVMLLDHMMPSPDGVEVLHIIKSDDTGLNYNTPAIILTANAIAGCREQYLEEGFDDYLSKPINSGLLEETVMKFIGLYKLVGKNKEQSVTEESVESITSGTDAGCVADTVKSQPTSIQEIEGLQYDVLCKTFGDNMEFIAEVFDTVVVETRSKLEVMKKALDESDYKNYEINAHGIKGIMASIYYEPLREHAREHEFAAKEDRLDYIKDDFDAFAVECEDFCKLIERIV